ncbi:zinc-ribbon and DUF3426 domain-containing protein [Rhodanobacter sp. L36]|uniref:zinc-ribbon and DUF3426 domain-containing protein n=1 Tax=Rhodanobacter sp. L36 TaxID=1747221 RepID=UPI00131A8B68|nr:zinc-ribbon and DUF3426 domain-containing protein [Rhodanobacter sp. L36]
MYTQCPECLSVFSLDAHTIAQAHGHVLCGHCGASFDSIATLTDQLPPEPFQELAVNEPAFEPPEIDLVVYRPRLAPQAVVIAPEHVVDENESSEDFSQLVFSPRFAREKPARGSARAEKKSREPGERRWPWVVVGVLLALLLGIQLAWAERDVLIRDPTTGGWLRGACGTLGCRLPLIAAPEQIELVASNVQAHPSVAGALMISASVRNDAIFAQPYPVLTITLSNAQGQRLSMRRLQPHEYLDDRAVLARGLAPGENAVLLLEVQDPGDQAVAFEFGFE